MNKGLTLIELTVVVAVIGVVLLGIVNVILIGKGGNFCEFYRYSSLSEVPVTCMNYLMNQGN